MSLETNSSVTSRLNGQPSGGATRTLKLSESGSVFYFDAATGIAYALPAIGSTEVGVFYDFIVTVSVTSNAHSITAQAADLLLGSIYLSDDTAAYTAPQGIVLKPDGTDDLIFSMNGTTKGGKIGGKIRVTAISATNWYIEGVLNGSGTLVSPFS